MPDFPTVVNLSKFTTNLFYRWKILRSIRKIGASIAIENVLSRTILFGDSIIRASGSQERLGAVSDLVNQTKIEAMVASQWYTKTISIQGLIKFEGDRNVEFLRGVGLDIGKYKSVYYLPHNKNRMKKYYVISPGASWKGRRWPIAHFIKLVKLISNNYELQAVVCGDQSDYELGEHLESACDVINMAGNTSIQEYINLISGAKFIIANESSAIHIAPRVGVASICILGGGHYGRFMPYPNSYNGSIKSPMGISEKMECFGCNWNCIHERNATSPVKCIELISVEEVYKLVIQVMDKVIK
jgi:ADP-heptose:LPS heptosyltransferase